jgi:hypothetical protein
MYRSRSIKAIVVFVGLLDLFWTREIVRESLGPEVLYLYLYSFILYLVNRNAIIATFILLLKQVCMCDQWFVLDSMRPGSTTLGVL